MNTKDWEDNVQTASNIRNEQQSNKKLYTNNEKRIYMYRNKFLKVVKYLCLRLKFKEK